MTQLCGGCGSFIIIFLQIQILGLHTGNFVYLLSFIWSYDRDDIIKHACIRQLNFAKFKCFFSLSQELPDVS